MSERETVELPSGKRYFSSDNWGTVWMARPGFTEVSAHIIRSKAICDLVRYIASLQRRDDNSGADE